MLKESKRTNSGMCFPQWSKKKPKLTKECLLLVATLIRGEWGYEVFKILKKDVENKAGEQCWYWGIFTAEGDEWGNYSDLVAEKYCVIEPLN